MKRRPPRATRTDTLCPETTRFRAPCAGFVQRVTRHPYGDFTMKSFPLAVLGLSALIAAAPLPAVQAAELLIVVEDRGGDSALPYYEALDRKSTRLNSSH